jgi:hypothetical protein
MVRSQEEANASCKHQEIAMWFKFWVAVAVVLFVASGGTVAFV